MATARKPQHSPKLNAMNSTFTGLFSEIEDTTIAR
jgi:hypothetical protein